MRPPSPRPPEHLPAPSNKVFPGSVKVLPSSGDHTSSNNHQPPRLTQTPLSDPPPFLKQNNHSPSFKFRMEQEFNNTVVVDNSRLSMTQHEYLNRTDLSPSLVNILYTFTAKLGLLNYILLYDLCVTRSLLVMRLLAAAGRSVLLQLKTPLLTIN